MITLVAEHWITPEFMDGAMKVFRDNTEKPKEGGGFVSRLVLKSLSDPSKITTVTTWKTEEEYQKFMAALEKGRAQQDPNAPKAMLGEKLEGYQVIISA
ncbi:MAG: antibiotic biosynthesis monooxygenase family protein [Dehalococcoidia bacterium]